MEKTDHRACPVKDCVLPIDIVLRSSDGVSFGAHMKNLEKFNEGFPQAGSVEIDSDVPTLEENAQVVELMLQFMHHTRQPELKNIGFNLLSSFAEAAEKYMIYSATNMCKVLMGYAIESHPTDVLAYAFKHGYSDLANKAAPLTMSMDSDDIVKKAEAAHLHDSFLIAWFRYRDVRAKVGRSLLKNPPGYGVGGLHKGGRRECELWVEFVKSVLSEGVQLDFPEPKAIADIISSYVSVLEDCGHCNKRGPHWQYQAETAAAEGAPPFVRA